LKRNNLKLEAGKFTPDEFPRTDPNYMRMPVVSHRKIIGPGVGQQRSDKNYFLVHLLDLQNQEYV